ncbi:LysM peptidoglycan-binding domain-containing protein [Schnuerera sp. xch1]|uniref:LysM peptidoglycan-binding domain-containing protein n=1 Tax=Schnuerera sp. xch1 TaxID=2874283 RepID=UPI001CBC4DB1|nr:LysM peptidoglycan-binding domain-containing protein [Schnuerera sp. xch1]MBZ2173805.1 LysM peptidoglycan-binding domain-containing protein [Schnuerera sp. xch1]
MSNRRYRIVNKRKFISFLVLMFIVITVIAFLLISDNEVYSSTYRENYKEILVREGDTLWNIAIDNMPDEYDVRKMVFEIRKFNSMKDTTSIYPGDLIKIPIKE